MYLVVYLELKEQRLATDRFARLPARGFAQTRHERPPSGGRSNGEWETNLTSSPSTAMRSARKYS